MPDEPTNIFADILNEPIDNPTGCWKDYNAIFLHWQRLKQLEQIPNGIIKKGEVSDRPVPSDYPNKQC